jgi:hypothetical protein
VGGELIELQYASHARTRSKPAHVAMSVIATKHRHRLEDDRVQATCSCVGHDKLRDGQHDCSQRRRTLGRSSRLERPDDRNARNSIVGPARLAAIAYVIRSIFRGAIGLATFRSSGPGCLGSADRGRSSTGNRVSARQWRMSLLATGFGTCPRFACEGLVRLAGGTEGARGRREQASFQLRLPRAYLRFGGSRSIGLGLWTSSARLRSRG